MKAMSSGTCMHASVTLAFWQNGLQSLADHSLSVFRAGPDFYTVKRSNRFKPMVGLMKY